jgi:RHS repeat-associated protein
MTKLEYTDGAGSPTTLEGWQYGLAADGTILRMASLTSQQRWDYGYDGRGRLTSAIRVNDSGVPQFREAYTYDDGDNMLTKKTVPYTQALVDTFADGNYTANPTWTVSGNWAVQNTGESGDNYIVNTDAAGGHLYRTQTAGDTDTWFSYKQTTSGTLIAHARFTDWDNRIRVNFGATSAVLYQNDAAVQTVLDTNASAGSDLNQWYELYFRCEGSRIEVWRGKRGEPLERILFSDAATETVSGQLRFTVPATTNYRIDNIRVAAPKTTTTSLSDDFTDGNHTANPAWTVYGGPTVSSGVLTKASSSGDTGIYQSSAAGDNQIRFSARKTSAGGWQRVIARWASNTLRATLVITDSEMRIEQMITSTTTLDTGPATTLNTWYDYQIVLDGSRMEVWRALQGQPLELVMETDALTVLDSSRTYFAANDCTAGFDNIVYTTADPSTTTSIYNDANELTSTTTGGVTTAYTYDGWGRTISKTDGTHDATYTWRFGNKLRVYTSDFPGEADVAYNYDGLGRRRNRLNNPNGAYTDADLTWYRWDTEWNQIGEYESDDYATWDVGDLEKHYTFLPSSKGTQLSHVDGSAPASGAYNYYAHDHLDSPRSVYSQAQAVVATQEFTPYGSHYATTGPSQTVGFTAHLWDASTHAFYAPFRYYSPASARWLSRDPLGMLAGPNFFAYIGGKVLRFRDPLGLQSLESCEADCYDEWCDRLQKLQDRADNGEFSLSGVLLWSQELIYIGMLLEVCLAECRTNQGLENLLESLPVTEPVVMPSMQVPWFQGL